MNRIITLFAILALMLVSCTKHEFRTEQITYNKTTVLSSSPSDSLIIDIEIEYPVDMVNTEVLPLIQKDLLSALLDQEVKSTNGVQVITDFARQFEQGYLNAFASDSNDSIGYDCWEYDITGRVMNLKDNLLSYSDEQYVFSGGRHGNNQRHFYNYDLKTGKCLTETDIFNEGYETELTQLLIENLIDQYEELETVQDLIKSDFRLEDIRPNGNFYFTEDEMVYVFNPYEIAPYYVGETEIPIPLVQIQDMLRYQIKAND